MYSKPLLPSYAVGSIVQYRNGQRKVKTEKGMIPVARAIAANSTEAINGGEELQKGWRVIHLDMSTYGEDDHDRPENLAVVKCRTREFKFLKTSRLIYDANKAAKTFKAGILV